MQDKDTVSTITRIVMAKSIDDAKMKVHREYKVNYTNFRNGDILEFEYDYSSVNSFDDLIITEPII